MQSVNLWCFERRSIIVLFKDVYLEGVPSYKWRAFLKVYILYMLWIAIDFFAPVKESFIARNNQKIMSIFAGWKDIHLVN